MNALCCENGIDFATEIAKGTKDCRNGFFFAVFGFLAAQDLFGWQFAVSDSPGTVAADGFNPQNMGAQKWGNLSGSLSACFACSAVEGLWPRPVGKSGNSRLFRILKSVVQCSGGFAKALLRFLPPLPQPPFGWIRSRRIRLNPS